MLKNGILAIAAVAALVLGTVSIGTKTTQAEALGSAALWCGWFASYDVNGDDVPGNDTAAGCDGLTQAELVNIAEANTAGDADDPAGLGDEDGVFELTDTTDIDLDDNQITDGLAALGTIYVFAFVDDDEVITFDADAGVTTDINDDGANLAGADDGNAETCEADDDLDCDNSTPSSDDGDGIAIATITEATGTAGDEIDVEITQADDTSEQRTEVLNVVGPADNIAVSEVANKATVQTDAGDCEDEADVSDGGQIADVDKTFVQAVVTDDDDVALTRVTVLWTVEDADISTVADDTVVTVDAGDIGTAAFAVICGGDTTGVNTITAEEQVGDEDESVEITTVGEPAAIALTASPAAIVCDGVTSSTVTATVTDSEGNNVAGGTNVNFSVVALGTANPINFGTVDGQASSQITPLAGAVAGVTVIVTSGDAQSSILVACNTPGAEGTPPAPVPTATPPGGVTPPDTGNGGYLGQDSSDSSSMWVLLALGLGAVALVGGGVIARRAAK